MRVFQIRLAIPLIALSVSLIQPALGLASRDDATLCETAARDASDQTGVPLAVLRAISLAETGRETAAGFQPWPWAMNRAGAGSWYGSRQEVAQAAEAELASGRRNFDLGCFQLNHRWHADAFSSIDAMLDPEQNALYAAQFLARLFAESQDWPSAAAAYHSRTPEYAERYRARFETILASLTGEPEFSSSPDTPPPVENLFPLLRAGARASAGSLMPLQTSARRLIGEP